MNWCFAIVNNKLSEIFFEKKGGKLNILGHTHVNKSEYKLEREVRQIDQESRKLKFIYKDNKYTPLAI